MLRRLVLSPLSTVPMNIPAQKLPCLYEVCTATIHAATGALDCHAVPALQVYFWATYAIFDRGTGALRGSQKGQIQPKVHISASLQPTRWWRDRRMCQYGPDRLTCQRWLLRISRCQN